MIRQATKDDFYTIETHCAEFWECSPFDEPYRSGSADLYLNLALDCGLLFVAESEGNVVGFAAGCVTPLMGDSEVLQGTELGWWVMPSERGGKHAIGLLKALEDGARELGCKYWNMVFMETSMPEKVRDIYLKMGYSLKETTYGKEL